LIIAKRKPLDEIVAMLSPFRKVLVAGCRGCVSICHAGGEKEVGIVASALRLACGTRGFELETSEMSIERQCEKEFLEALAESVAKVDAVLSLGCGIGVQAMAARFEGIWVFPGVNTHFLGMPVEQGVWLEKCGACGNCILASTGGICPVACCSKSLLNGPCGGSEGGRCEVDPETMECGWSLIYERLKRLGRLDLLDENRPPKDWRTGRDAGVRRIVREDLQG
jgi:ferredoxin